MKITSRVFIKSATNYSNSSVGLGDTVSLDYIEALQYKVESNIDADTITWEILNDIISMTITILDSIINYTIPIDDLSGNFDRDIKYILRAVNTDKE